MTQYTLRAESSSHAGKEIGDKAKDDKSIVEHYDRLKVWFLSAAFFFIIGSYTIANELKSSVFRHVIGVESIPTARILTMFLLVPLIFFYARTVDKLRRHQLVMFFCGIWAVIGLVFAYFLAHPTIGIPNAEQNPYRIFGWLFYFFIEGYPPFVVSVFWAFVNSVSSPQFSKDYYAYITAASKFGGALTAGLAWFICSSCVLSQQTVAWDTYNHQMLLIGAALLLFVACFIIYLFIKFVPSRYLHGYEAAYQFERERKKEEAREEKIFQRREGSFMKRFFHDAAHSLKGMTSGLMLFVRQPYVLGIFGMVFLYETVYVVFSYLRVVEAQRFAGSMSEITCELYKPIFFVQAIGVVFALFGTYPMVKRLGERACLMLIPGLSGFFLLYMLFAYSPSAVYIGFIGLRVINYAFTQPVRESLYIPTIKDLKFKSKSWIDTFGSKLAKSTGSAFNILVASVEASIYIPLLACFFTSVLSLWFATAFLLGKRYERAITHNEVIGGEEEKIVAA